MQVTPSSIFFITVEPSEKHKPRRRAGHRGHPHDHTLQTPAEYEKLPSQDLSRTACVVFHILRATTTIITALANGAALIVPAADIGQALKEFQKRPDALLAGERGGFRITAAQSGGVDFHLGNSPREFPREVVLGKTIITTTTNGTRALRACADACAVFPAAFINLGCTARAGGRRIA